MELTEDLKGLLIATGKELSGSVRRLFMARTVKALGRGGASRAERELGWNRKTIRKGLQELEAGALYELMVKARRTLNSKRIVSTRP